MENIIRNPYDLMLLSNCNANCCAFMSLSTHNSKIAIQHLAIAWSFLNGILEKKCCCQISFNKLCYDVKYRLLCRLPTILTLFSPFYDVNNLFFEPFYSKSNICMLIRLWRCCTTLQSLCRTLFLSQHLAWSCSNSFTALTAPQAHHLATLL